MNAFLINLRTPEQYATTLLTPPHSLAPVLGSPHLLSAAADVKLKHGVLGLAKHLAQSASQSTTIHAAMTEAGIVQRMAASGIWDEKADVMADVIQLNAIGVVKHLCRTNRELDYQLHMSLTFMSFLLQWRIHWRWSSLPRDKTLRRQVSLRSWMLSDDRTR
jgi:hypothetical protein